MNRVPRKPRGAALEPHFKDVQAHYDLSNEFFQLFLDPTQTYSAEPVALTEPLAGRR